MRILVTGGAGFIGSHLVEKLLATGHEVSILDDFNDFYDPQIKRANVSAVAGDVPIHRIDLRDSGAVNLLFHREKFDAIAHLAARAGVRPSIRHPQLYYDTNVGGTLHLLEAARLTGIQRFIFASSSSVYGVSKTVPFSESLHLTQTISPYAATKIAGEFLCSTFSHLYQMRIVALRFFTVYGARQRPDLAIHQFTRKIHAGEPIDQFGDGTRSYKMIACDHFHGDARVLALLHCNDRSGTRRIDHSLHAKECEILFRVSVVDFCLCFFNFSTGQSQHAQSSFGHYLGRMDNCSFIQQYRQIIFAQSIRTMVQQPFERANFVNHSTQIRIMQCGPKHVFRGKRNRVNYG